jgi:hypothetical protein
MLLRLANAAADSGIDSRPYKKMLQKTLAIIGVMLVAKRWPILPPEPQSHETAGRY